GHVVCGTRCRIHALFLRDAVSSKFDRARNRAGDLWRGDVPVSTTPDPRYLDRPAPGVGQPRGAALGRRAVAFAGATRCACLPGSPAGALASARPALPQAAHSNPAFAFFRPDRGSLATLPRP